MLCTSCTCTYRILAGLGVLFSLLQACSGEKLDSALSLVSQPRHEHTGGPDFFPDQDRWFPKYPIFPHRHRKLFQSTPTSGSQTYRIVPGDTLNAIAERFGVTVDELVKANNIQDADKINAGDTLVIPSEGPTRTYTVVAGDTLTIIATRFNSTVQELTQLNNLANPDSIVVGQMLRVSAGSSPLPDQTSPPPSPTPPSPPPPSPPSQIAPAGSLPTTIPRVVHRTCTSDTLESLAKLYNTTKEEIMKSNGLTSATQKLTAELFIPTTTEPTFLTYTVKSGDMLFRIATNSGLTLEQLLEDNPELKANPDLIFPGQQLRLRQSPTQESVGGNCTGGSTPATSTSPVPRPDNQGGMSTTDLLRLVLAPVLTGIAAICTIAYTLWKCHQKGRLFKEHRKAKRAASGSDRRGSELGSTTASITPAGSTAVALDNIPITLVGKPVYALREVVNQADQAPGGNATRALGQQRGPLDEEEDEDGFFRDQQRPVESVHCIQRHL